MNQKLDGHSDSDRQAQCTRARVTAELTELSPVGHAHDGGQFRPFSQTSATLYGGNMMRRSDAHTPRFCKRPYLTCSGVTLLIALAACGNDSNGTADSSTAGAPAIPTAGANSSAGTLSSGGATATAGAATNAGGTALSNAGAANPQAGATGTAGTAGTATTGGAGSNSGGAGGTAGSVALGGTGGSPPEACPSPPLKSGDTTQMVTVGASSRSYVLHVPAAYDGSKRVPLIVDFHPLGGSGPSERTSSPYPAQTDAEGVIMAFPSGQSGPSGGAWNVGPCCVANVDDVAFAKALVAQVQKTACVDAKRVYAVGFSMGGGMSHYLACHAADVFAAVAPAAFDLLKENIDDCKPSRPISVVSFRSTGDPVVAYAGGYSALVQGMPINFLGAKATFDKWAQINQCTGSASAEDAKGCSTYSTCGKGVEVTLCTKQGGSHEAGNASVGWPILKKHVMP
jgi:polyhydroxybutyrate depolymerase